MKSIFLILLFMLTVEATRFYLNGTVVCEAKDPEWCFTIQALELDSLSRPEEIARYHKCLPGNITTVRYVLDGVEEDDGWFDSTFELGYKITHSCGTFDTEYELYALQFQLPIWKFFYFEQKWFNLTDNTIKHVSSICDFPEYQCMEQTKFYFTVLANFDVKRPEYKIVKHWE
ncbi:hypothetical protein CRE_16772 [Caenorhabditis remanei]|uniref:Uncharacterized protein n=1 Tax=Caenorhabditis remanei TaxID=31234 RepID=E3MAY8_CAERE|nr:hypothetical protein CRE_16772 [Caenorhabditis remanei]